MKTLLIIDLQNDFLPGGSLPVADGDHIVPLVNELVHAPFDLIVASKDWHPLNHGSFAKTHNKEPGDHILLNGIDQLLWPMHCVQGSIGSEFAPGWDTTRIDEVFYKGIDPHIDSYSAFFDNKSLKSTGLDAYLKEKGAKEIYIVGLATDYCVKYSVLDALQLGFEPYIVVDACRGVNIHPQDSEKAFRAMIAAGAKLITFSDLMFLLSK